MEITPPLLPRSGHVSRTSTTPAWSPSSSTTWPGWCPSPQEWPPWQQLPLLAPGCNFHPSPLLAPSSSSPSRWFPRRNSHTPTCWGPPCPRSSHRATSAGTLGGKCRRFLPSRAPPSPPTNSPLWQQRLRSGITLATPMKDEVCSSKN